MPEPKNAITPEIEIAWARAVSRAFDDPSYYRYLKADPKRALTDLGADVGKVDLEAQVREAGGLTPTLATLDTVIAEVERKRTAARSGEGSGYRAPSAPYCSATPCQPTQPGAASCPSTVHVHIQPFAMSIVSRCAPTCIQPSCVQPQGNWVPGGLPPGWPCVAMSQVATARVSATKGVTPPQWIGGPPSGAA